MLHSKICATCLSLLWQNSSPEVFYVSALVGSVGHNLDRSCQESWSCTKMFLCGFSLVSQLWSTAWFAEMWTPMQGRVSPSPGSDRFGDVASIPDSICRGLCLESRQSAGESWGAGWLRQLPRVNSCHSSYRSIPDCLLAGICFCPFSFVVFFSSE